MEHIDALAKQIEQSYQKFQDLVNSIDKLHNVLTKIEGTSDSIVNKFKEVLNEKKVVEVLKNTEKQYSLMQENITQLNQQIDSVEIMHQQIDDSIKNTIRRIDRYEQNLKKAKSLDTKLSALINTVEKNKDKAESHFYKASTIFEANREIEKYDELIELQRENNKLLKKVLNKGDSKELFSKKEKKSFLDNEKIVNNHPNKQTTQNKPNYSKKRNNSKTK